MRLEPDEVEAIREVAGEVFGPGAVVRLFGSRVRDELRGGDIDLHVVLPGAPVGTLRREIEFLVRLEERIGERRVDLTVRGADEPERPIDRIAVATGIVL